MNAQTIIEALQRVVLAERFGVKARQRYARKHV